MALNPCQQCGAPRKLPAKFQAPREVYEAEPFCTRKCCEIAHGIRDENIGAATALEWSA